MFWQHTVNEGSHAELTLGAPALTRSIRWSEGRMKLIVFEKVIYVQF